MNDRQETNSTERTRKRFDSARAQRLDEPARFVYLSPERVIALVEAPTNAVVLDFGAGTGAYAVPFAAARPDCTVLALDTEPAMLDHLRVKPGAERVRTGGPELLSEWRARVDAVFAINVLHELEDEHLAALVAALAADARVVAIDWNPEVERPGGPANEHLLSPEGAAAYLERFGLRTERIERLAYQYAVVARRA